MAAMLPHTRAIVAAAAFAIIARRKVTGVHDHFTQKDLQIAAESRGEHLQAYDGARAAWLRGDLPELHDSGNDAFVSLTVSGSEGQGYDRHSSSHFAVTVTGDMAQLYDHTEGAWFAFTMLPD
jgi:hypothetical protein